MREALRALEYEGLVASKPQRGFTVTFLTAEEVDEVCQVRTVLEGYAIRVAIPLLTDTDIAELTALHGSIQHGEDPVAQLTTIERLSLK